MGRPRKGTEQDRADEVRAQLAGAPISELPPELRRTVMEALEDSLSEKTKMGRIMRPVSDETWALLQDIARSVRYRDFLYMKMQTFERLRALALSDEFEELPDASRDKIADLKGRIVLRAMPEYTTIRERYRAEAERLAAQEENSDAFWENARPYAQKAFLNLLKNPNQKVELVMQAAGEILDRTDPKRSRGATDGGNVVVIPESVALLLAKANNALEAAVPRETKLVGAGHGGD